MNKYMRWIIVSVWLPVLLAACGDDHQIYLESAKEETVRTETQSEHVELYDSEVQSEICYDYVCGAVKNPGVYALNAHDRVYQAIRMAGGLKEDAFMESVNQAEKVTDGQMLKVLTRAEAEQSLEEPKGQDSVESDGRVDLNHASAAELMSIPGIGQAKAESIISYREEHGPFSSIEDVMKIEGIKEGVFNRMKDSIRVK